MVAWLRDALFEAITTVLEAERPNVQFRSSRMSAPSSCSSQTPMHGGVSMGSSVCERANGAKAKFSAGALPVLASAAGTRQGARPKHSGTMPDETETQRMGDSTLRNLLASAPPEVRRDAGGAADTGGTTERPGDRIARYKLIEKLGEGGFGAVWRAEQSEPIRREVALKVIKAGMDSAVIIARFEVER